MHSQVSNLKGQYCGYTQTVKPDSRVWPHAHEWDIILGGVGKYVILKHTVRLSKILNHANLT